MATASLDQLRELLGEDFDDVRPLGEDGGMSRLFRAHKRSLDLDVVIKRMRMDPSRTNQPPAQRVVTPGRFEPYTDYQTALGGIRLDMLRTSGGVGVRVTVDRWRLGAVSGEFELAGTAAVDWLLASPSSPAAFRWEDMLALGRYDWMRADAPPAPARLWLRPGGGTKTR